MHHRQPMRNVEQMLHKEKLREGNNSLPAVCQQAEGGGHGLPEHNNNPHGQHIILRGPGIRLPEKNVPVANQGGTSVITPTSLGDRRSKLLQHKNKTTCSSGGNGLVVAFNR